MFTLHDIRKRKFFRYYNIGKRKFFQILDRELYYSDKIWLVAAVSADQLAEHDSQMDAQNILIDNEDRLDIMHYISSILFLTRGSIILQRRTVVFQHQSFQMDQMKSGRDPLIGQEASNARCTSQYSSSFLSVALEVAFLVKQPTTKKKLRLIKEGRASTTASGCLLAKGCTAAVRPDNDNDHHRTKRSHWLTTTAFEIIYN